MRAWVYGCACVCVGRWVGVRGSGVSGSSGFAETSVESLAAAQEVCVCVCVCLCLCLCLCVCVCVCVRLDLPRDSRVPGRTVHIAGAAKG